jgi:hypothetical protein
MRRMAKSSADIAVRYLMNTVHYHCVRQSLQILEKDFTLSAYLEISKF